MAKSRKTNDRRSGVESVQAAVSDESTMVLTVSHFDMRFEELLKTLATKEDVTLLKNIIEKQKEVINNLESRVTTLETQVSDLAKKAEDSEQYSRRQCLRIEGIPLPTNDKPESENDLRLAVKKLIKDARVNIPDDAIDRAHRIGRVRSVAGKKCQQVILKCTSFYYRTLLYRARKGVQNHRIYLDLTKTRKDLLDQANKYFTERRIGNCFAFADVNCRLCLKLDGEFRYFRSYEEFLSFMGDVGK